MSFVKRFAPFSLLFLVYISMPKTAYGYCTINLTYKPTLVVATAEKQTTECEQYKTTTSFQKMLTIKGNAPDQFEIDTVNKKAWDICKNYVRKSTDTSISLVYAEVPNPDFEIGKNYILPVYIDSTSSKVSLAACTDVEEVKNIFDPKILLWRMLVYFYPVLISGMIIWLTLYKVISGLLPSAVASILSIILILLLIGIFGFAIFKGILYLLKRLRI